MSISDPVLLKISSDRFLLIVRSPVWFFWAVRCDPLWDLANLLTHSPFYNKGISMLSKDHQVYFRRSRKYSALYKFKSTMNIPSMTDVRGMKMFLPALSKINSFSDNTSSSRIFNISKWPVISRRQSINTWYSLITVSFTATEPHYVPNSFPIPHLFIFSTFTNKDVCHSLVLSYRESGSVCRRLKLSSSLVISSQMIGRWTWECFCSQ